jgi:hypothetical protein
VEPSSWLELYTLLLLLPYRFAARRSTSGLFVIGPLAIAIENIPGMSRSIPSEKRMSLKWEDASYTFFTHTGIGLAVGMITSIVLFRRSKQIPARVATCFYGAGCGTGISFVKINEDFKNELLKSSM